MLITCRTLTGQKFTVNGEATDLVKKLKESIQEAKGDAFPAEHQKLIFSGKVMVDDQTLEHYGVNENGFVVVMATKPKPPAPSGEPSVAAAAPAAAAAESGEAAKPQASTTEAAAAAAAAAPAAAAPAAAATGEKAPTDGDQKQPSAAAPAAAAPAAEAAIERENSLLHGEEYEAAVTNLVNMGFPRQRVQQAMQASFNNPDRAAEYLLSGNIPNVRQQPQQQQQQQSGADELMSVGEAESVGAGSGTGSGAGSGTGSASSRFIEQLHQWPQFLMLRRLVAQDQSVLPELLQQIGQSNPQLLQEIQANQEEFLNFLNEPDDDEEVAGDYEDEQQPQQQQQQQQQRQPQQTLLRVTVEERAAIDRLKDLGFPEHMVIEAYFACDKNEDAAANFLLNEGFDNDN